MSEFQVCVVDDDQYYNKLVSTIIEQKAAAYSQQVKVNSYKNGYDCVQNGMNPALVFLDFYLSTENDITQTGLDVLKKLKKSKPNTKVVFMSQEHDWENFKEDLIAEGAMDFIKKDNNLSENINKILSQLIKR